LYRCGGYVTRVIHGLGFNGSVKNPFANYVDHFYNTRLKAKANGQNTIDSLCKLLLNSIYGKTVTRDIEEKYIITSKREFALHKNDHTVKDFDFLSNGQVLMKIEERGKSFFPSQFGSYILAHSRRVMNDIVHAIDGFNTFKIWYTDTDSLYIDQISYLKLQELGYVGDALGQGKNDNKSGGVINYAIFAGPKMKYCEIVSPSGETEISVSFKGIQRGTEMLSRDVFL